MVAKLALVRFSIFSRVVTFNNHDDLVKVITSTMMCLQQKVHF